MPSAGRLTRFLPPPCVCASRPLSLPLCLSLSHVRTHTRAHPSPYLCLSPLSRRITTAVAGPNRSPRLPLSTARRRGRRCSSLPLRNEDFDLHRADRRLSREVWRWAPLRPGSAGAAAAAFRLSEVPTRFELERGPNFATAGCVGLAPPPRPAHDTSIIYIDSCCICIDFSCRILLYDIIALIFVGWLEPQCAFHPRVSSAASSRVPLSARLRSLGGNVADAKRSF